MRVFAAQMNPIVGDVEGNGRKILATLDRARSEGVEIVVFPELALSGYPPEDLLLDSSFIRAVERMFEEIVVATRGLVVVLGLPRRNPSGIEKPLYNSAAVMQDGQLIGFHDKQLLPTYDVFDERRFFEPGEHVTLFEILGKKIAITICEDVWQHAQGISETNYRMDPVARLQEEEIDLVLNLSSSPYSLFHEQTRFRLFSSVAKTLHAPIVFCNQVGANDQLIFDGHSFCVNERGELLQRAAGFVEEDFLIDFSVNKTPIPFPERDEGELYHALVLGVRDYFHKQGFSKALIGVSGGIDSAVTTMIAREALGEKSLLAFYLPSRFSSAENESEVGAFCTRLGVDLKVIDIDPLFQKTLDVVEPYFEGRSWDFTEENMQARIRGQILMAFANKWGALLFNTGNKSEMATGFTTLYGDLCGGLGVLADVTKTRVYRMAQFINRDREQIPASILKKPATPELHKGQRTQDRLPPWDQLDPVIEGYLEEGLSPEGISKKSNLSLPFIDGVIASIHRTEYKRRQAPMALRVTQKAFDKGRNVPIVQRWKR